MTPDYFRVIWSDGSIRDLRSIYHFLSKRSEKAAIELIKKILECEPQIVKYPLSGTIYFSEGLGIEFRFLIEGNYKIIYRIEGSFIMINAIFDTRQDPDKLNYIKEPQPEFSTAASK